MKPLSLLVTAGLLASTMLACLPAHAAPAAAAETGLSADKLNQMEKWGLFTPSFKAGARALVEAKDNLADASVEEKSLKAQLPNMLKEAVVAEKKANELRLQLQAYQHSDDTDFIALKKQADDPKADLQEVEVAAQTYVWAYPTGAHAGDAQGLLLDTQKKLADQVQAIKDATAARNAAHTALVQRARAKDLALPEWRDFMMNMSQEDVLKLLGQPELSGDYWLYKGGWTTDLLTHQRVGLRINFNAGRVINVSTYVPQ